MNWVNAVAFILVMSYGTASGATLSWDANTEPDLAGYRVYQCSQQPCGRAQGTAAPLITLDKVTSYNIGTPNAVRYFVITAYDALNNESNESDVVIYTPPNTSPSSPPPPVLIAPPAPTGLHLNGVS